VFDYYGSREFGLIGVECDRHEGLHVPMQTLYMEVLRDDGSPTCPGEVGRIVITSLTNYSLPLIRYEIGDLAAWAETPCSCGRVWPLLRDVKGRISDMFVKSDGGLLAGEYFHAALSYHDWVAKYQVVQDAVDQLRVRIVLRRDVPDLDAAKVAGMKELQRVIHLGLGRTCAVSFEFVDEIEPTASGKFRFTISRVREGSA
jgi:phenylacetate-CoA ligase